MVRRPRSRDDFRFAIICALPSEYDAVCDSLDDIWGQEGGLGTATGGPRIYTTGRIGNLHVVVALLPGAGKGEAASSATCLRLSYSNLAIAFVVGICGAVPQPDIETEILLGDIIISKSLVQYDFGRENPDGFERNDTIDVTLGRPNKDIRALTALLSTRRGRGELEGNALERLRQLQAKAADTRDRGIYNYPGAEHDRLFNPKYRHKHRNAACDICQACLAVNDPVCRMAPKLSCTVLGCGEGELVTRSRVQQRHQGVIDVAPALQIHVGTIGSADRVMRSGEARDKIAKRDDVIAFEMEGAGVWDEIPCIIVKGVSDYADSHKQKDWQNYAAGVAASAVKAIISGPYFQQTQEEEESLSGKSKRFTNTTRCDKCDGFEPHCDACEEFGRDDFDDYCSLCEEFGHDSNEPHCKICEISGHYTDDYHCFKCLRYGHGHEAFGHKIDDLHCYKCKRHGHSIRDCRKR
ncbi:hypothetical protein ACSS6W_000968 [Trichoderma asperelloides]